MTLWSSAKEGVKWTSLAAVVTLASEVLRTVVLSRLLSPTEFGLMAMVTLVVGLAQMYCDAGMSTAVIHRQEASSRVLSTLFWLNVGVGGAMFLLFWGTAPLVSAFYNEPRLPPILRAVGMVFLVASPSTLFDTLLQKDLRFDSLAKRDMAATCGQTVVAVAGALCGFGIWALVCGFLAASVLRSALLLQAGLGQFRPSLHFDLSDLRGLLGFSAFQLAERSAYYVSQRADQFLVGSMLGASALGYYSFAFNLAAQPLARVNPVMTKVAFPVFAKMQGDGVGLKNGYLALVAAVTALNAPILIGLAAVAPVAIPAVFGAQWTPSVRLVQILSIVVLLRAINNPIGALLYSKGRVGLSFAWHCHFLLASLTVVALAGLSGTTETIAWAMLGLQGVLIVPMYFMLLKPVLGPCAQEFAFAAARPVASALAMGALVMAIASALLPVRAEFSLGIQAAVGGLAYAGFIYMVDRRLVLQVAQAMGRR